METVPADVIKIPIPSTAHSGVDLGPEVFPETNMADVNNWDCYK